MRLYFEQVQEEQEGSAEGVVTMFTPHRLWMSDDRMTWQIDTGYLHPMVFSDKKYVEKTLAGLTQLSKGRPGECTIILSSPEQEVGQRYEWGLVLNLNDEGWFTIAITTARPRPGRENNYQTTVGAPRKEFTNLKKFIRALRERFENGYQSYQQAFGGDSEGEDGDNNRAEEVNEIDEAAERAEVEADEDLQKKADEFLYGNNNTNNSRRKRNRRTKDSAEDREEDDERPPRKRNNINNDGFSGPDWDKWCEDSARRGLDPYR